MKIKNIVIIPARGGSKRLPGKNIRTLGGKPLLAHSIHYAQDHSDRIDAIYVSTNDASIKEIAIQYGAQVIDRPEELSRDESPTISTLVHALNVIGETQANVILLQPTNPLRPVNLLKEALKVYCDGNHDSLVTVSPCHKKLGKIGDGKFIPYNYTFGQRSQDMEPLYYENGLLYITSAERIREGIIFNKTSFPFIVNHPYAEVDIDTEDDFRYAEFLLKNKQL